MLAWCLLEPHSYLGHMCYTFDVFWGMLQCLHTAHKIPHFLVSISHTFSVVVLSVELCTDLAVLDLFQRISSEQVTHFQILETQYTSMLGYIIYSATGKIIEEKQINKDLDSTDPFVSIAIMIQIPIAIEAVLSNLGGLAAL